jgi:hypothetical protein
VGIPSLVHASVWLLALAGAAGAVMAALRYAKDRPPPPLLVKLHGFLASAGLALLLYGWAAASLPRIAVTAIVLLLATALGGLAIGQARRWRRAPSPEVLIFGHMSLAASGFILLLAAAMSLG